MNAISALYTRSATKQTLHVLVYNCASSRSTNTRLLWEKTETKLSVYPGDDITSIQQEITMMKECKHKNIVAYFGSYHRCWMLQCRPSQSLNWRISSLEKPFMSNTKIKGVCVLSRNTKLWICMEYCGGGSLQDIYHGINTQIIVEFWTLVLLNIICSTKTGITWHTCYVAEGVETLQSSFSFREVCPTNEGLSTSQQQAEESGSCLLLKWIYHVLVFVACIVFISLRQDWSVYQSLSPPYIFVQWLTALSSFVKKKILHQCVTTFPFVKPSKTIWYLHLYAMLIWTWAGNESSHLNLEIHVPPNCQTVITGFILRHLYNYCTQDVEGRWAPKSYFSICRNVPAGSFSFSLLYEPLIKLLSSVTGPLKEKQIAYVCRETLQVSFFNGRGSLLLWHHQMASDALLTEWLQATAELISV